MVSLYSIILQNSISCNLVSNGTACSKFNVISPQCNVSVYYTFNTCNLAPQTNFTIIRYSARIIHADVSPALVNGTIISAGTCKTYKQTHLLNTCDMKTDFASLYVRGKINSGLKCEDYLFHWANGLESLTDSPSIAPTKSPVVPNRVPTRVPLPSGQFYFSPTSQLIAGSNVCSVKVSFVLKFFENRLSIHASYLFVYPCPLLIIV